MGSHEELLSETSQQTVSHIFTELGQLPIAEVPASGLEFPK